MTVSFITTNTSKDLYTQAKDIRTICFFNKMKNASELINDAYEKDAYHAICSDTHGNVIGTGRIHIEKSVAVISQMAVKPEHQKSGVGQKLLKELLVKCKQIKVKRVELSARETAIQFYSKYGFLKIGVIYSSLKTGILHQKMYQDI